VTSDPSNLARDEEYPEVGQYSPTDPAVVRPAVDGLEEPDEIQVDYRTN
jgi:hypothetical protein